jgi:uncharacterized membrane protein
MASVDNARIRPRGLAAIAAVAVFMALAVTGSLPVGVAVPPTADPAEASTKAGTTASAQGHMMALHKGGSDDVGIRGRGFVADNSVFTTIDAPGARSFTVAFGIDNRGRTVGGYADDRGTLHGFLRDKEAFTVIDFPGAVATLASKINAQGQIVGAYSEKGTFPPFNCPTAFFSTKGCSRRSMSRVPCGRNPSASTTLARSSAGTGTLPERSIASCGTAKAPSRPLTSPAPR